MLGVIFIILFKVSWKIWHNYPLIQGVPRDSSAPSSHEAQKELQPWRKAHAGSGRAKGWCSQGCPRKRTRLHTHVHALCTPVQVCTQGARARMSVYTRCACLRVPPRVPLPVRSRAQLSAVCAPPQQPSAGKSRSPRCVHKRTGASQALMDFYHCERQTHSFARPEPCKVS